MGIIDWIKRNKSNQTLGATATPKPAPPVLAPSVPKVSPLTNDGMIVFYVADGCNNITDRDTFDYKYGDQKLPDPAARNLDELLATVTRVRALSGGIFRGATIPSAVLLDTSEPAALDAFRACLTISEDPSTFGHCACLGGPTLELFARGERVATVGLQHGRAIRWSRWKHDATLRDGLSLDRWMKGLGLEANLLAFLYSNPLPFSGGRVEGSNDEVLTLAQQRHLHAVLLRQKGDLNAALTQSDLVIARARAASDLRAAYLLRGSLRAELGELEAARADLSHAIELGEESADVFFERAVVLDRLGLGSDAIADCTQALVADPKRASAYNSRGLIRMKQRAFDEAQADLDEAVRLSPEWELPRVNRAMLAMHRADWATAVLDYTAAIDTIEARHRNEDAALLAKLYGNRAYAHASRGDHTRSEADLDRAGALDPGFRPP